MTRGFPARRIDRGCRQSVYLRSERRKRGGDVRLSRGINRRWQDSVAKSAELRSSCTSPTISCVSSRAHPATSTEVGSLTHRETPVCVHAPPFERKRKREWLDSKKSKNSLPVYESLSLSLSFSSSVDVHSFALVHVHTRACSATLIGRGRCTCI